MLRSSVLKAFSSGARRRAAALRSDLHRQRISFSASSSVVTTPALSARFFSAQDYYSSERKYEINISLPREVQRFLEAPTLHVADFAPTSRTLQTILRCCKQHTLKAMKFAEEMVERMVVEKQKKRWVSDDGTFSTVVVPIEAWEYVLYGWAKLAQQHSSRHAQTALQAMKHILQRAVEEALYDRQQHDMAITERLQQQQQQQENSAVLSSSSNSKTASTPAPSVSLLSQPMSQPTVDFFNSYLHGLSMVAKQSPAAARQAEALIDKMLHYHHTYGWHCKPNTKSYTLVLNALANAQTPGTPRALNWLRRMQEVQEQQKQAYLEQYGVEYNTDDPSLNKRRIVTVGAIPYTTTMQALSHHHPGIVVELLQEMISNDIPMDAHVWTTALKAQSRIAERGRNPEERLQAAQRAEDVLNTFVEYHSTNSRDDHGNDDTCVQLLPVFNACLDAYSKTYVPEAALECERILQYMLDKDEMRETSVEIPFPNTTSFNTCLHAWSRSNKFHADATHRAEALLMFLHELHEAGVVDAPPDFQTYACVILSFANSDHPQKLQHARRLLDQCLERVPTGQVEMSRNAAAPFAAVLKAAARSNDIPSSPSRQPSDEPTLANDENRDIEDYDFYHVIDDDAYSVALQTYQQVQNDAYQIGVVPDHHLYAAFLNCLTQLLPLSSNERATMSQTVWQDACESGQVSRLVVDRLHEALADKSLLLQQLDPKTMPRFWSRNVPSSFRFRGKVKKGNNRRRKA